MFPSCPLSKHNTEPFDHKLLKRTVSIKSDPETHSRGAAQPPHSRFTHLREEDGRQTVLPSFFSKFSRKKVPCKTHLSPALPLSNSTFCEMGWSLLRCTENGHVYPVTSDFPFQQKQPPPSSDTSLVQPGGSAHQQKKHKDLAFYIISLLKHCLASSKLLSKSFNHFINLLPLKYLCSMLPSRVNFEGRHWRNKTKRALGTEINRLRSREPRTPRRPFRSAPLLTPPSAPQPLPPLPAAHPGFFSF